jgi:hypothetical protein
MCAGTAVGLAKMGHGAGGQGYGHRRHPLKPDDAGSSIATNCNIQPILLDAIRHVALR